MLCCTLPADAIILDKNVYLSAMLLACRCSEKHDIKCVRTHNKVTLLLILLVLL